MRIALLNAQVPFVRGGAELLAEGLQQQLREQGHEAEIVSVPLNWHPSEKLVDSLLAGSLVDLDELGGLHIDLAIGLKFPAYLARHANKRFWIIHQHRQAYDHWEDGSSDLLHQGDGAVVKAAIEIADREAFAGRAIYTISQNVTDRLQRFLNIASTPIYHPPPLAAYLKTAEEEGDYLLVPSRIGPAKRQHLVLEALGHCREPVRLIFVGKADDLEYEARLHHFAARLGLDDRISFLSDLSPEALADLYARARAVVFVPVDEDYGYVTLEAMLSGRPVVTATDAGGPLEFIRHEREGLVSQPNQTGLAEVMDRIWADSHLRRTLGEAARARYDALEIGWSKVLDRLLDRDERLGDGSGETTGTAAGPVPPWRSSASERMIFSARADRLAVDETAIVAELPTEAASLDEVLDSFDLGRHANTEVRRYLEGHWLRYLETMALIPRDRGLKVLDLGGGMPHAFLALVHLAREKAEFAAIVEAHHEGTGRERFASTRGRDDLVVDIYAANLEISRLPLADESVDVVLAMEVLEHLALNPAHMFAEAQRVLRPGGTLIVTTPNIVSYRSLALAQSGQSPYSFGVFVPYHGVYGRHNREYTPHEVEVLGRMTGFDTSVLRTRDVYRQQIDEFVSVLSTLTDDAYPLDLRGQNIFYRGTKTGKPEALNAGSLYLEYPFAYRGAVTVESREGDSLRLRLRNEGTKPWAGETISIRMTSAEPDGATDTITFDLPVVVPAGTTGFFDLPIGPRDGEATSVIAVELQQSGRGWLHFLGIANIRLIARAGGLALVKHSLR